VWVIALALEANLELNRRTSHGPVTPVLPAGVQRGALALGIVGLLGVLTNLWMFGVGENLSNGTRSPATFVVGVTPPYATVIWDDPAKVPDSYRLLGTTITVPCKSSPHPSSRQCMFIRPLLFLGTANDRAVVWDCRAHATYFVANADARIELSRERFLGLSPQDLSGALGCTKDGTTPALLPSPSTSGQQSAAPSPRASPT
jgi:hypothetical protein